MADDRDARWAALTHWIVVFEPSDHCESLAWTGDNGKPGPRSAEEAAELAFDRAYETLAEHARQGGNPVDELEVLVFERGKESGRFVTRTAVECVEPLVAKDWRPTSATDETGEAF